MAEHYDSAIKVVDRCTALERLWAGRNKKIGEWYDTLSLFDELEQKDMESFTANDPRTFYNSALHLLAPNIPHRIPIQGLDREGSAWASSIERAVTGSWSNIDRQYRRRGRKSWMQYITGLLLVTGWYSVLTMAAEDSLVAEVWNPVEVYPEWDSSDLSSVAHIYTLGNKQAKRFFASREWDFPAAMKSQEAITIYDLWELNEDGVINVTATKSLLMKEETQEPFEEIPILVGPAGGLPDDGPITGKSMSRAGRRDWRASIGQSILATNEGVYKNYNRVVTFMQQILRDTAQPKYWEKSRGQANILTEETLAKRGAIFSMAEGDDVGTIQMPGIPVELTSLIGSYEQQIQRGSLPHALSGQVQNIPLGLMSQVAAAAVQVLSLYHGALTGILTDIDNIWVEGMLSGIYKGETLTIPQGVSPDVVKFDIKYAINIPGDLIQRATVARMIAPNARLAGVTGLDIFFPEIQDPDAEMARARAEDAQVSPVFTMLTLISALREEADLLARTGNSKDAELLRQAGEAIAAQLGAQLQGQQGNGTRPPSNIPAKGIAPNEQELLNQLGVQPEGDNNA